MQLPVVYVQMAYCWLLLKRTFPVKQVKNCDGKITDVQRKAFLQQGNNISSTWETPSKQRKTISSSHGNSPTGVVGQIQRKYHQMQLKTSAALNNSSTYATPWQGNYESVVVSSKYIVLALPNIIGTAVPLNLQGIMQQMCMLHTTQH